MRAMNTRTKCGLCVVPEFNKQLSTDVCEENQGNLSASEVILLVILLAGAYVLKAKALSVRGAFSGIYRGNDMSYICFKIPQPSTSPKWMGGGDR